MGKILRVTESTLRQLIRENLLTEAIVTPQASLDMGLHFMVSKIEGNIEISVTEGEKYIGELRASKNQMPCSGAWSITWAYSKIDGLGPLMYDLMMDLISPDPLSADRHEVSSDAWRVWSFYLNSRSDIEAVQLDDSQNTLTRADDDNCQQISAIRWSRKEGGSWQASPLSKAYRRKDGRTPTLNTLWRLGNLDMDG